MSVTLIHFEVKLKCVDRY